MLFYHSQECYYFSNDSSLNGSYVFFSTTVFTASFNNDYGHSWKRLAGDFCLESAA